ncbi:MAG: UDP-N-acetylmuramoyl-tripeptide--D-alanyl-D-alanine ligase [Lachnospiraceae bacterium]|nr:UDP-N-acetylmuramoyl-tripeptide--D-alanyl-D-alanine ligase [Lachnospiraceae bacterium]MBR3510391.1 UDP-N-acetylmuramoyl-tripeptide--D-alanyl-D-alanine ligase [Lachnospiraceae bacterium]MBR4607916.1 UDP-N-acetylmuramoyl-tripeptide--D-alanyl-D-alanine ligase [Lachnospiraceae bacterium]
MIFRTIIAAALAIPAYCYALRYNMHMFQLNGYKNDEHPKWLRKNLRQQWLLVFTGVLGILRVLASFIPNGIGRGIALWTTDILTILTLLLVRLVYRAMKRLNTKSKFNYTPRVKRMITTIVVMTAIAILISLLVPVLLEKKASGSGILDVITSWSLFSDDAQAGFPGFLTGVFLLLISLQLVFNMISNVINKPIEKGVNQHYINDAKRILKSVPGLQIIGVTGSYGKTSVKFYLQTLLQGKYNVLVTPESYNTPMGIVKTIRGSLKPTHEIFICEMGARHVGDIKEDTDIVHPHHGVITSVGPQHLETFHSMENIQKTKFELADCLPEGGKLFLNGDNEYIQQQAKLYKNKFFYYSDIETGTNRSADSDKAKTDNAEVDRAEDPAVHHSTEAERAAGYCAKDIAVSQMGTEFTVTTPNGEEERFQMKLVGAHNVINVVGAISVAHQFGMSLKELKIPVRRIQPVEHRMQMREQGNVTIIDDAYNSNPVGSKAAVETLAMFDGIRILVTPGMVELGKKEEEYNYKFGTYAADCCDYILIVGKKNREAIRAGVLSKNFPEEKCICVDKLEDAMAYAYSIKGQGHKYILLENDLPDNY